MRPLLLSGLAIALSGCSTAGTADPASQPGSFARSQRVDHCVDAYLALKEQSEPGSTDARSKGLARSRCYDWDRRGMLDSGGRLVDGGR